MTAYTQADLDALEQAMLRAETTVSIGGRSVTFATTEELVKRIEYVRKQLASQDGRQRLLAEFSKGVQS